MNTAGLETKRRMALLDCVDRLAEKIIDAFEPLGELVVLEQIAVPEQPDEAGAEIDLWLVSAKSYGLADGRHVIQRDAATLSSSAAWSCSLVKLTGYFRERIAYPEEFRRAGLAAEVAAKSSRGSGGTGADNARLN